MLCRVTLAVRLPSFRAMMLTAYGMPPDLTVVLPVTDSVSGLTVKVPFSDSATFSSLQ